jgi:hypothetical protein
LRRYVVCSRLTLIIINNHASPYLNTHLSSTSTLFIRIYIT